MLDMGQDESIPFDPIQLTKQMLLKCHVLRKRNMSVQPTKIGTDRTRLMSFGD
jgi:hypothetical protein